MYSSATIEHLPVWDPERKSETDRAVVDYIKIQGDAVPPSPQYPLPANLGDEVALLGYDLTPTVVAPGEAIRLTLYWKAQRAIERDYTVFVHLIDGAEQIWGQKDNQPEEGFYPTSHWDIGEVVKDGYEVLVEPDTPPGRYRLEIGMYLLATGERLSVLDEEGQPMADRVLLSEVRVR